MIITVLWEDQQCKANRFAANDLLVACIADMIKKDFTGTKFPVESKPLKGNGNIKRLLTKSVRKLNNDGPLFAVFDRDKVVKLWNVSDRPNDCMSGIQNRIRQDAPGEYELVFLCENMESLVEACCKALSRPLPKEKLDPNERDVLISRVAWSPDPEIRKSVLAECPSFARLVEKVAAVLPV